MRVFRALEEQLRFENYLETGTYLGMTTHFLSRIAQTRNAHVYSCEISDMYYDIAVQTVGRKPNVFLWKSDSVHFLRALAASVSPARNFVYLDAHWYDYLPLREELAIISGWPDTLVMIDDFKVPFDPGFGWDKYDNKQEICYEFISDVLGSVPAYFPKYPASAEKASPRGYCLIGFGNSALCALASIPLLKRFGE